METSERSEGDLPDLTASTVSSVLSLCENAISFWHKSAGRWCWWRLFQPRAEDLEVVHVYYDTIRWNGPSRHSFYKM